MNRRDGLATLLISMDIEQKQPATTKVAADCGVSERTVRKWLTRLQAGGESALNDRSAAPARQRRLPPKQVVAIEALRWRRLSSPVIARQLVLPLSTVGSTLRRLGLGHLKRLDPPPPVVCYQGQRAGELVHIDTKKLGKLPPPAARPQRSPAACCPRGTTADQPACHEQPAR
jgi:hypothetical protein